MIRPAKAPQDELTRAFGSEAPEHFAWQTACPFVADEERALVGAAFLPLGERILDVGCGEGATLAHLGAPPGAVGVDLFEAKVAFARRHVPGPRFQVASAEKLPFSDARFDQLIVRDLIHHLAHPQRFVAEARRVLAPGGRVDVLEPCRNNPLIFLHAVSSKVERGELRSTAQMLTALFEPGFWIERVTRLQPLPMHRLIFHPVHGRPELAQLPLARKVVAHLEAAAARIVPRWAWAYIHVRAFAAAPNR